MDKENKEKPGRLTAILEGCEPYVLKITSTVLRGLCLSNEVGLLDQKNTWRMTLTFPCINASKNIVIYVLGAKKQELIKEIYSHRKPSYPIEQIGTDIHPVLWMLDQKAAELLPELNK